MTPFDERLITFPKKSVKLKGNHTYEQFIIKRNEDINYSFICAYLSISYDEARQIYDEIWNVALDDIGTIKTGLEWRG